MEWVKAKYYLDDPVEGVYNPLDVSHFKTLRFHLNILNCWPGEELGENVSKYKVLSTYAYIVIFSYLVVGGFMYTSPRDLTLHEVGHIYVLQILYATAVFRFIMISLAKKCKYVFSTFISEIHLLYYKEKSEYTMKMYKRIHRITHYFTLSLITESFSGLILFILVPVYRNYSNGLFKEKVLYNASYEHAIYYAFPLDIHSTFNVYIFTLPFNLFVTYIASSCFIIIDLLLTTMIFHLWGHLKILNHQLGSFPLPKRQVILTINNENYVLKDMYSDEESAQVAKRLGECINYHRYIIKFANTLSKTFGPMMFVYYMVHQAIGCLLLLLCSQMTLDALITYGPLTFVAYQLLIQLSMIFELIGSTSEKLKDSVYGLPWEYMGTSNRKTVLIFLMRVQEPIHVKALGLADVGVTSMAAIIKTSLTYFMFLRTF